MSNKTPDLTSVMAELEKELGSTNQKQTETPSFNEDGDLLKNYLSKSQAAKVSANAPQPTAVQDEKPVNYVEEHKPVKGIIPGIEAGAKQYAGSNVYVGGDFIKQAGSTKVGQAMGAMAFVNPVGHLFSDTMPQEAALERLNLLEHHGYISRDIKPDEIEAKIIELEKQKAQIKKENEDAYKVRSQSRPGILGVVTDPNLVTLDPEEQKKKAKDADAALKDTDMFISALKTLRGFQEQGLSNDKIFTSAKVATDYKSRGDRWMEKGEKIVDSAPQGEGLWFEAGSMLPQVAGLAASIAVAPWSAGASTTIGLGYTTTLGASAAGSFMMEYDRYHKDNDMMPSNTERYTGAIMTAAAEMAFEKLRLDKATAPLFKKLLAKEILKNPKFMQHGASILEQFQKQQPGRWKALKELGVTSLKEGNDEGLEEMCTEVAGFFISNNYKNEEHKAGFNELIGGMAMAYRGGVMMGGLLGPVKSWSNSQVNRIRRNESGMTLGMDKDGNVFEILGEKDGQFITIDKTDKTVPIAKEVIVDQINMNPQQANEYLDAMQTQEGNLKQMEGEIKVDNLRDKYSKIGTELQSTDKPGTVEFVQDDQQNTFAVLSRPDANSMVVVNTETGEKSIVPTVSTTKQFTEIGTATIQEFAELQANHEFQQTEGAKQEAQEMFSPGQEITYQDKKYILSAVAPDGMLIAEEVLPDGGMGESIEISPADQKGILTEEAIKSQANTEISEIAAETGLTETQEAADQVQQKVDAGSFPITLGEVKTVAIPNEDGTYTIDNSFADIQEADQAVAELNKKFARRGFEFFAEEKVQDPNNPFSDAEYFVHARPIQAVQEAVQQAPQETKPEISQPQTAKEVKTAPIQQEKVKILKPRSKTKTRNPLIAKLLDQTPETFEQSFLQYLLAGGRISREDFIRHTGWGERNRMTGKITGQKELNTYFWALQKTANGGLALDVLHESLPTFGLEDGGAMDVTNEAISILKSVTGLRQVKERLMEQFGINEDGETQSIDQQMEALGMVPDVDDMNSTESLEGAEIVELVENIVNNPDLIAVFNDFTDEQGNVDFAILKQKLAEDEGYFTIFPFGLTEEGINELQNILNDGHRQAEINKYLNSGSNTQGNFREETEAASVEGDEGGTGRTDEQGAVNQSTEESLNTQNPWELTLNQYVEAVFNGDIKTDDQGINDRLVNYHDTTDPQNKQISKDDITKDLKGIYLHMLIEARGNGHNIDAQLNDFKGVHEKANTAEYVPHDDWRNNLIKSRDYLRNLLTGEQLTHLIEMKFLDWSDRQDIIRHIDQILFEKSVKEGISKTPKNTEIENAEAQVNTNPTEAQIEAGNYKKGHVSISGLQITIENPIGSYRKGTDANGKTWKIQLNNSYGYFRSSKGKDGDQVDAFLGSNMEATNVYIVDQVNPETGKFDEHKVMVGFNSAQEALAAYNSNYEPGWTGAGAITAMPVSQFKTDWLIRGVRKNPVSSKFTEGIADTFLTNQKEEGKEYGSENKVFKKDAYLEALERLRKGRGNLNSGINPQEMLDSIIVAGYHIESGSRKFGDFARNMVESLGEWIKPYLKGLYENIRRYPDMDSIAGEMDPTSVVDNFDLNNIKTLQDAEQAIERTRTSEAIEVETENLERQSESIKSSKQAGEIAERADNLLEQIDEKIAALTLLDTVYETDDIPHESPNLVIEKDVKRDVAKYSKGLAEALNWEHDTDKKGKPQVASVNIAPAGGDAGFILWKPNSNLGVYVSIPYDQVTGGYQLKGQILWRVTSKENKYTGFSNHWANEDITVAELRDMVLKAVAQKETAPVKETVVTVIENQSEVTKQREALKQALPPGGITLFEKLQDIIPETAWQQSEEGDYLKSGENGDTFMPFSVEKQGLSNYHVIGGLGLNPKDGYRIVAEQFYIQEGDLMTDPRIDIVVFPKLGIAYPVNWEMAAFGYKEYVVDGKVVDRKGMADTMSFINDTWIPNLISQDRSFNPKYLEINNEKTTFTKEEQPKLNEDEKSSNQDVQAETGTGTIETGKTGMVEGQQTLLFADNVPGKQFAGSFIKDSGSGKHDQNTPSKGGRTEPGSNSGNSLGDGGTPGGDGLRQGNNTNPGESIPKDTGRNDKPVNPDKQNHVILPGDIIVPQGERAKVNANIAAIKLVKKLIQANRDATPSEKQVLAKYTGWGGLANVFAARTWDENWNKTFGVAQEALREMLTREEYNAARNSTLNAHYTDRGIIESMWSMASRLGFQGGTVLEPAGGIGHFLGLMPQNFARPVRQIGFELDQVSGQIFSKLYPQARVNIAGYETSTLPNNSIDLAISNVPFGDIKVFDKANKDISSKFNIHNYFIAKSLRLLKPGGVAMFITTSATMDNEGQGKQLRTWVDSIEGGNSDLIEAVRLPNNAFKANAGTEVTTDILIFRKRTEAGKHPQAKQWINTNSVGQATKQDGKPTLLMVNEFFAANQGRMLGTMRLAHEAKTGGLYSGDSQTLQPLPNTNLIEQLAKVIETMPQNISDANQAQVDFVETSDIKEGSLIVKDGKPVIVKGGQFIPMEGNDNKVAGKYSKAQVINDYNGLKDSIKELNLLETDKDTPDSVLDKARATLNKTYDTFIKKYGTLSNNAKINFLRSDVENSLVFMLERVEDVHTVTKEGKVETQRKIIKSDIFTQRVNPIRTEPTTAANTDDAMQISLAYKNRIDLPFIASLLNTTEEAAKKAIVDEGLGFFNPTSGVIEDSDTYLSGYVRVKLEMAEEAAKTDDSYNANVEALKRVIPEDIPFFQIEMQLGAPWVPSSVIKEWIEKTLGIDADVSYSNTLNRWSIQVKRNRYNPKNTTEYAGGGKEGIELALDALNTKATVVMDSYMEDGKRKQTKNIQKTEQAQAQQTALRMNFKSFAIELSEDAKKSLERAWNDTKNSWVNKVRSVPKIDFLPGASTKIKLDDHQKIGIKRTLSEPVLLAHGVGTGKTFQLIGAAMEMRRLKTANKPMIVVQKSTIGQFAQSFRDMYPGAKILIPTAKDMSAQERQDFFAKVALNDWDAIIIHHDALGTIPDDPKRQIAYINERIEELMEAQKSVEEDGETRLAEEMGREIDKLQDQISNLKAGTVKGDAKKGVKQENKLVRQADRSTDNVIYFEQLGVDALLVDEAHVFKRLGFATKAQGIKGIDTAGSKRSFSAMMKVRHILESNGNKNVVFATGTPISNTMAEAWTMMKYLIPGRLKEYGISHFDEFKTTFGEVVPGIEFTAAGNFKNVDRFAEYINLPEFQKLFRSVADVVLGKDIESLKAGVGTPRMKNDNFQTVEIEQTKALEIKTASIKSTLQAWELLPPREKRDQRHVPLVLFNLAKRAAIDVRLVDPTIPDDTGSKATHVANNVVKLYKESDKYKGTQLIFADAYQSSKTTFTKSYFNLYHEIKRQLIEQGVKESEIEIIHDHDTDIKKEKLFERVNSGDVRVLMGTTSKLGVGVNVQRLLKAVHHVDTPDRPMDFEQRNGRILRRGNTHLDMGLEVDVILYGVNKTLDATAYGRLGKKNKFIQQLLSADMSQRKIEDSSDDTQGQTFEQMMANLSGSQYAVIHTKRSFDLKKLEIEKDMFANRQRTAYGEISRLKSYIEFAEYRASVHEKILALSKENNFEEIKTINIEGKLYGDPAIEPNVVMKDGKPVKVGEALQAKIDEAVKKIKAITTRTNKEFETIHFRPNGAKIFVKLDVKFNESSQTKEVAEALVSYSLKGDVDTGPFHELSGNVTTGAGVITSMQKTYGAEKLEAGITTNKELAAKYTKDITELEELMKGKFPKEEQLQALKDEVAALEVKMKEEMETTKVDPGTAVVDINKLEDNSPDTEKAEDDTNFRKAGQKDTDAKLETLTPAQRKVAEERIQGVDARIEAVKAKIRDANNRISQKKNEIEGQRTTQGDLFGSDKPKFAGSLFDVGQDFSQDNISKIVDPIRAELKRYSEELAELNDKRDQIVDTIISGVKAQTEMKFKKPGSAGERLTQIELKRKAEKINQIFTELSKVSKHSSKHVVVETADQLVDAMIDAGASPLSILKVEREVKKDKTSIDALFDQGSDTVFVVASNVPMTEKFLQRLWLHEQGVHKGLRLLIPNSVDRRLLLNAIYDSIGGERIIDIIGKSYADDAKHEQAEEYLAWLAENYDFAEITAKDRQIWTVIKEFLNELVNKVFGIDLVYTDIDVKRIIQASVRKMTADNDTYSAQPSNSSMENYNVVSLFHGTNRRVSEFSTMFSGTGEGDSAGGFGTYLSEAQEVGIYYANYAQVNSKEVSETEDAIRAEKGESAARVFGKAVFFSTENNIPLENYLKSKLKGLEEGSRMKQVYQDVIDHITKNPLKGKPVLYTTSVVKHKSKGEFNWFNLQEPISYKDKAMIIKRSGKEGDEHRGKILRALLDSQTGEEFIEKLGGLTRNQKWIPGEVFSTPKEASQFMMDAGFDGNVFPVGWFNDRNVKTDKMNIVVYDESMIMPPSSTRFKKTPDGTNFAGQALNRKKPEKMIKTKTDKFREVLQDRMLSVRKIMDIVKERGGKITESSNPYIQENLASSRFKAEAERFNAEIFDPLLEKVADLGKKTNSTLQEIESYMKAKHAPERNKHFFETKGIQDGSGMSTEDAKIAIKAFESKTDKKTIDDYWKAVSLATDYSLTKWKEYGFMSNENYDSVKGRWNFYVPLRGWLIEEENVFDYVDRQNQDGFNFIKKAEGRTSESDNPLHYIISMAHSAIAAGEKNRIKQAAARMVRNNPNMKDLFQYKVVYYINTKTDDADGKTIFLETTEKPSQEMFDEGLVQMKINSKHESKKPRELSKQHEVEVNFNGQKSVLVFTDPSVSNAINYNNQIAPELTEFLQNTIGRATRWLSANFTAKNPAFIPINLIRDYSYAMASHYIRGDGKQLADFMKHTPKARTAINRHLKGKFDPNNKYDVYYKEFQAAGGETGYIHLYSLESLQRQIERDYKRATGTNSKADKVANIRLLRNLGKVLENYAIRSENLSRFATYATARDQGATPQDAAYQAKQITVNFNRKGRATGLLGSLFAFFNASIQGGHNVLSMGKRHKEKFIAVSAGYMATGFLSAMMNDVWGDDDEEDDGKSYDTLSDFVKYHNLVIPGFGKNKFITIPLPHGFRTFHSFGVMAYQFMAGQRDINHILMRGASNIMDSLSVMDATDLLTEEGGLSVRPIVPTAVVPFFDIMDNQDFSGRRIYNEGFTRQMEANTPNSQQGMRNTNKAIKAITDNLFELGGGDKEIRSRHYTDKKGNLKQVKDVFDWNPAKAEHFLFYYLGGRGQFWNDTYKTASGLVESASDVITSDKEFKEVVKQMEVNNLPVVRRLYRTPWTSNYLKEFYQIREDVDAFKNLTRQLKENGRYDQYLEMQQNEKLKLQSKYFDTYEKQVKNIQQSIDQIENKEARKALLKAKNDLIIDLVTQVNNLK